MQKKEKKILQETQKREKKLPKKKRKTLTCPEPAVKKFAPSNGRGARQKAINPSRNFAARHTGKRKKGKAWPFFGH